MDPHGCHYCEGLARDFAIENWRDHHGRDRATFDETKLTDTECWHPGDPDTCHKCRPEPPRPRRPTRKRERR